jgi:hypothetical protein
MGVLAGFVVDWCACAEASDADAMLPIDSEMCVWRQFKGNYLSDFPELCVVRPENESCKRCPQT